MSVSRYQLLSEIIVVNIININFSGEICTAAPDDCRDIIPYTTKTNKLYELETEEDYKNFSDAAIKALEQCTIDAYTARWGVCNMMFPRCLLGWELQFCRQSCLGNESINSSNKVFLSL